MPTKSILANDGLHPAGKQALEAAGFREAATPEETDLVLVSLDREIENPAYVRHVIAFDLYRDRMKDEANSAKVYGKMEREEIFRRVKGNGDIYLGEYEDWYCTPCETFWTENQLMEGNCPDCGRATEKLQEPSYFFRMSKYQEQLLAHIEANPDFIQPKTRRNEPMYLTEVLKVVAEARDQSEEHVAQITTENARRFFNLPPSE